ncbi:maleylpyruvate isomerase family mycothiol-dependent enzyme [Pseudonocardia sp. N23]|uniref:maleylpyruvate isomerase family mycothiol-dependent enzyme n=1 Tax=Pseudonocardia sp. N23 TaxID=1987376 RepID=UPI000BFCE8FF|nr:maleylpyruvate isomerase family mycothiol-dependent enzyme [Pseudonocardia sp. N23]GAY07738.1 maleylpyruvate isomerase, mycothiol-dependent [Pseudonocardia sp. N23]
MTPRVEVSLAWAGDGAAHLRGLMVRLGEDAYAKPSALPGWTRAHVLTHVARNADAMMNLLTWARTGVETPAYASDEQRDADIEAGARRSAAVIRADVEETSDRLSQVVKKMPEQAWSATVRHRTGVEIPAAAIPWMRAREMWIHAVDLDVGASFADMPIPMAVELLTDVAANLSQRPGVPAMRLVADDGGREWAVGDGSGPVTRVLGPMADLAAWVSGRGRSRAVRRDDGTAPPELPGWL